MNEADRLAARAGRSVFDLMESAGRAVAGEIARRWTPRPIAVLCGPGNNGGDGFVAALALSQSGWTVRLALLGTRDTLRGAALAHAKRWPGSIEALNFAAIEGAELVVDAIFGSGLNRTLDESVGATLTQARERNVPIIAVDVPSGVHGDSGISDGAVPAVCTVTFAPVTLGGTTFYTPSNIRSELFRASSSEYLQSIADYTHYHKLEVTSTISPALPGAPQ